MTSPANADSLFLREVRLAARLSHPHIIAIHSVDEVAGFVFYVMTYVEGETLAERVRSRGPVSATDGVRILREVTWALGYAHGMGVVHRDVKPDNILIEASTGRALVADYRAHPGGRSETPSPAAPCRPRGSARRALRGGTLAALGGTRALQGRVAGGAGDQLGNRRRCRTEQPASGDVLAHPEFRLVGQNLVAIARFGPILYVRPQVSFGVTWLGTPRSGRNARRIRGSDPHHRMPPPDWGGLRCATRTHRAPRTDRSRPRCPCL
jgi:serine/threonine protein kinase